VNFEKEEDAAKAIAELNNQMIGNQVISVGIYDRSQQAHVFVGSQDVIQNENMKALHIQGISKDVSNNQRIIVRLEFLWAYGKHKIFLRLLHG
jgi:RNA recognition motif-containing protein